MCLRLIGTGVDHGLRVFGMICDWYTVCGKLKKRLFEVGKRQYDEKPELGTKVGLWHKSRFSTCAEGRLHAILDARTGCSDVAL